MVELSFSAISERDIDLLVLEALATCDGFARWFLARVGFDTDARLVRVAHSVGTASGETDIELTIEMHRAVHRILVENKLDAAFQPRQPERYAERAAAYIRDGLCAGVTTVLLAPQEYLNGCREHVSFDHYVPLEDVRDEIRVHEPGSPRSTYKQILLDKALD